MTIFLIKYAINNVLIITNAAGYIILDQCASSQSEPILHQRSNLDPIEHYVTKDPQCLSPKQDKMVLGKQNR